MTKSRCDCTGMCTCHWAPAAACYLCGSTKAALKQSFVTKHASGPMACVNIPQCRRRNLRTQRERLEAREQEVR